MTVHPLQLTDVLVTLHGARQQVSLSVEPPEAATVAPSTVLLGDGESATVQLAAVTRSVTVNDVKLVARVVGFLVGKRTFTNIDAEIISTDIRVEPNQEGISLRLHPSGMTGLRLTLDLLRSNGSVFNLVNDESRDGGDRSESFRLAQDLPSGDEGEFTSVRARWGVGGRQAEVSKDYHFKNLGRYRLSQYNTPEESDETCQGAAVPVCFVDTPCTFIQGQTLPQPFESKTNLNGSGRSLNHGLLLVEAWCLDHANPPGDCDWGGDWHIYRTNEEISTSCGGGVSDVTVARNPAHPDLQCGARVFITGGVGEKSVTDQCRRVEGCAMDQLDNYTTTDHRCSSIGDLRSEKEFVIKLCCWQ